MNVSTKFRSISISIKLYAFTLRYVACRMGLVTIAVLIGSAGGYGQDQIQRPNLRPDLGNCQAEYPFGRSDPGAEGVNIQELSKLTRWVRDSRVPILSVLISRNGRVVYELYTSSIKPNEAHYLMSVTKSVTSALVGVAIGHGLLRGSNQVISEILPRRLFPNQLAFERFQSITLKEALGMSALDAPVFPHLVTPDAKKRLNQWWAAKNRVAFALSQQVLPSPGYDFQYTDVTPSLVSGAVQYSSGITMLEFANQTLFGPLGFKNQEWMHQDPTGIDNGAFGLRLRPIDMQKFGILYLDHGCWQGKRLIPRDWVELSLQPWIPSQPELEKPNYGWYWWRSRRNGWNVHFAEGWKGQRIAVFSDQKIVVTMTAIITNGDREQQIWGKVVEHVTHLLDGPQPTGPAYENARLKLDAMLKEVHASPRVQPGAEKRMVPSVANKEAHAPFQP